MEVEGGQGGKGQREEREGRSDGSDVEDRKWINVWDPERSATVLGAGVGGLGP